VRGWRTVSVTQPGVHPWASAWWGAGHVIGYAEPFVHQLADFLCSLDGPPEVDKAPPTFEDGLRCQRVLAALAEAGRSGCWQEV
jgi:predicted dehydrogenase